MSIAVRKDGFYLIKEVSFYICFLKHLKKSQMNFEHHQVVFLYIVRWSHDVSSASISVINYIIPFAHVDCPCIPEINPF